MATKQTTQLCYQVNGGTCRNKVSAKNYYVCAAGHRAVKGMSRDEIATQLPAEAIRKMGEVAQRELARNPSIDRDIAQALFDTGDHWIRRDLATNPSIDRDIAQFLFDIGNWDLRYNLAKNPSIDHDMAQALFSMGDEYALRELAMNPSIDRDMAVALAKEGVPPTGYVRYKSVPGLLALESLSLISHYPKFFGEAYLDRLLNHPHSDDNEDNTKTLLLYAYDAYAKTEKNKSYYKSRILDKYPDDEELKILLS